MIILIADDDRLVRFTVKSMLADILTGDYTILETANGRDMIQVCKDKQPDIVFADINMPYVNGLDAIEECKKYAERMEYVIISGYSEFEYAKRGISLGINEYLLKPVDEDQLIEVMNVLLKKLEQQRKESNSAFQLKLLDLFNYFSTVGIREEYEEFPLEKNYRYLVFGLFMENKKKREEEADLQQKIMKSVQKIGEEAIKTQGYYALVYSDEGTPYFVFAVSDEERILSRVKKFNMSLGCENGSRMFYFCGKSMKEIYEIIEELDENSVISMNYKEGQILEYKSIKISASDKKLLKLIGRLLKNWKNADGVGYKEILNKMYREYKDKRIELNLEYIASYCSDITGKAISASSYKEFCRSFVEISESMYEHVEGEDSDIIEQLKEYVQRYYMNDISISQLSEQYHLTANYLSTLFHNRAGCKFIDYLTEIRMMNARKLLIKNTTASVQDIAMLVGYNSARHFSTLFQKQTGMTPTAYRKSRL